jgi:hypothetical protein
VDVHIRIAVGEHLDGVEAVVSEVVVAEGEINF